VITSFEIIDVRIRPVFSLGGTSSTSLTAFYITTVVMSHRGNSEKDKVAPSNGAVVVATHRGDLTAFALKSLLSLRIVALVNLGRTSSNDIF